MDGGHYGNDWSEDGPYGEVVYQRNMAAYRKAEQEEAGATVPQPSGHRCRTPRFRWNGRKWTCRCGRKWICETQYRDYPVADTAAPYVATETWTTWRQQ
jgi:hypothetical protein